MNPKSEYFEPGLPVTANGAEKTTQAEAGLSTEEQWDKIHRNMWLPLHPEWEVRMLRKGEPLQRGDFRLTRINGGQALHMCVSDDETVEETGDTFRYESSWPFRAEVELREILEWVESQQREIFHRARLTLEDLASSYRDNIDNQAAKHRAYADILDYMDKTDFGCLVTFCEDSGMVTFTAGDDEE